MSIHERIRVAYIAGATTYHDLIEKTFPADRFPRAMRRAAHGGPPGCAMAFNKALKELRAIPTYYDHRRGGRIRIPQFDTPPADPGPCR